MKLFGALVILGLICIALLLAWSIGMGFLLSRILPFSLFEGSVLVMLASLAVGYAFSRITSAGSPFMDDEEEEEEDFEDSIPAERFIRNAADKTYLNLLRLTLANEIALELEKSPKVRLDKPQRDELAIRLTDLGISVLRGKSTRAKRLKITSDELREHMRKENLKPYDDDLLMVAVGVINMALTEKEIAHIVRDKLWDKLMIVKIPEEKPGGTR